MHYAVLCCFARFGASSVRGAEREHLCCELRWRSCPSHHCQLKFLEALAFRQMAARRDLEDVFFFFAILNFDGEEKEEAKENTMEVILSNERWSWDLCGF